jgi:hypothetical protein
MALRGAGGFAIASAFRDSTTLRSFTARANV